MASVPFLDPVTQAKLKWNSTNFLHNTEVIHSTFQINGCIPQIAPPLKVTQQTAITTIKETKSTAITIDQSTKINLNSPAQQDPR